jgi:hypothetical protein
MEITDDEIIEAAVRVNGNKAVGNDCMSGEYFRVLD